MPDQYSHTVLKYRSCLSLSRESRWHREAVWGSHPCVLDGGDIRKPQCIDYPIPVCDKLIMWVHRLTSIELSCWYIHCSRLAITEANTLRAAMPSRFILPLMR